MKINDLSLFREQCYVDGQWTDADNGATFSVTNPADGSKLGEVPSMGQAETARAIDAAAAALPAWASKTAKERSVILRCWYELILENQQDLATIMTLEMGKPLAEALGEVIYGASFIEWFSLVSCVPLSFPIRCLFFSLSYMSLDNASRVLWESDTMSG